MFSVCLFKEKKTLNVPALELVQRLLRFPVNLSYLLKHMHGKLSFCLLAFKHFCIIFTVVAVIAIIIAICVKWMDG